MAIAVSESCARRPSAAQKRPLGFQGADASWPSCVLAYTVLMPASAPLLIGTGACGLLVQPLPRMRCCGTGSSLHTGSSRTAALRLAIPQPSAAYCVTVLDLQVLTRGLCLPHKVSTKLCKVTRSLQLLVIQSGPYSCERTSADLL
eukprot:11498-Heterococcus_DN1.PRE.2